MTTTEYDIYRTERLPVDRAEHGISALLKTADLEHGRSATVELHPANTAHPYVAFRRWINIGGTYERVKVTVQTDGDSRVRVDSFRHQPEHFHVVEVTQPDGSSVELYLSHAAYTSLVRAITEAEAE